MNSGVQALSDKEKETLRLLLKGHDAKSIAREQTLSVHTVNERLRDARRKLGVSSSREAARRLAEAEQSPELFGDKQFGVAGGPALGLSIGGSDHRPGAAKASTWLIGGTLAMSLIIATVLLSSVLTSSAPVAGAAAVVAEKTVPSDSTGSALSWVALVDAQKWDESWNQSGTWFKSQIGSAAWTAAVQPVRKQVGPLVTRKLKSTTKHSNLPGAPAGEYEIVEFSTAFTKAESTVETVVLARESSGWKVVGYFVKPA